VRVTGRFGHLRTPDAFPGYLRRTMVNLFTSQLRRRALERDWIQRQPTQIATFEGEPEMRDDLWRALAVLPARQRASPRVSTGSNRFEWPSPTRRAGCVIKTDRRSSPCSARAVHLAVTSQGRMGGCDGPGSSGAASGSSSRAVSIASVAAANVASRSLIRAQASIAVNG
jgi:hypothetical protein